MINKIIPILPKRLVKIFAKPYIAGETDEEALEVVRKLNDQGFSAVLDILGEQAENGNDAIRTTLKYMNLLEKIDGLHLDCGISIKPTHLGLNGSKKIFNQNIRDILSVFGDMTIQIDMEDSPYTTQTIETYIKNKRPSLTLALQSYLIRTLDDIEELPPNSSIRVCKGIYNEEPNVAFQDSEVIRANFNEIVHRLLHKGHQVAIATHDFRILSYSGNLYSKFKDRIEFQFLYGVPVGDWPLRLKGYGYNVRMYVPFGKEWYPYCMRRMKENPKLITYVLRNLLNGRRKQAKR